MNTVFHIVCWDVRRLSRLLTVWLVLIVGKAAATVAFARGFFSWPGDWMGTAVTYINAMEGVLGFGMAALLVQDDSPVDTRVVWRTRPVSGSQLLAAKLIGGGLMLVVLPVLLLIPIWMTAGLSMHDIVSAALSWGMVQGAICLMALAVTAVSENYAQMLIGAVGVILTLVMGSTLGRVWEIDETLLRVIGAGLLLLVPVLVYMIRERWAGIGVLLVSIAILAMSIGDTRKRQQVVTDYLPAETALSVQLGGGQALSSGYACVAAIRRGKEQAWVELREVTFDSEDRDRKAVPEYFFYGASEELNEPARLTQSLGELLTAAMRVRIRQIALPIKRLAEATWSVAEPKTETESTPTS